MRPILGLLLALSLLAGCGDEPSSSYRDPSAGSSPSPSSTPGNGPVAFELVAMVTESAVGGEVDEQAVDLSDQAALADFLAQFDNPRMEQAIRAQIDTARFTDSQALVGAVVAVGCLPPTDVVVARTDRGLMITGVPDKREATVDCFAAATSVAIVAVDAAAL